MSLFLEFGVSFSVGTGSETKVGVFWDLSSGSIGYKLENWVSLILLHLLTGKFGDLGTTIQFFVLFDILGKSVQSRWEKDI